MNEVGRLAMLRKQRDMIASRIHRRPCWPAGVVERRLYHADAVSGEPTRLIATLRPGDTEWVPVRERKPLAANHWTKTDPALRQDSLPATIEGRDDASATDRRTRLLDGLDAEGEA